MAKLIITSCGNLWTAALSDGNRIIDLEAEPKDLAVKAGDIFVGKIEKIVPALNAAFVEYQKGKKGYLPLEEKEDFVYLNGKKPAMDGTFTPKAGDELLVQIEKEPVRSKDAALTARLCISGTYNVLRYRKNGTLHFSSRIKNQKWKDEIKETLQLPEHTAVTVRTESFEKPASIIQEECDRMAEQLLQMIAAGRYRTCYSLLRRPEPFYAKFLKSLSGYEIEEVVTDDNTLFHEIEDYRKTLPYSVPLRFYDDNLLPLSVLYKVTTVLEEAVSRRVWLKSGAFLVIDITEAMVVIDVNSGKYSKKADKDEMILQVNLEAAKEILRQLRIRNLSGIIMIDFINMEKEAHRLKFMEAFRQMAAREKHKTAVVEMTKLYLVELTRKREKQPLYEVLKSGMRGEDSADNNKK